MADIVPGRFYVELIIVDNTYIVILAALTQNRVSFNIGILGSLAQLAEQRTLNPSVAGSSPARPREVGR